MCLQVNSLSQCVGPNLKEKGPLDSNHKLQEVLGGISSAEKQAGRKLGDTRLIAVSKTFAGDQIEPVLRAGHRIFGENRVQESQQKWPQLIQKYPDVELHLIGPLQSNKAADAVALFDVIHTVDREKIAKALAAEMSKQGKKLKLFVQVNTGLEEQKAGIAPDKVIDFVNDCRTVHDLEISGLMCIPPFDDNPGPHFALLRKLAKQANVEELSMGMSGDYQLAIEFGSTCVRVGSAIFGTR